MAKRRGRDEGGVDERGDGAWRLRYRIDGRRFTKTVHVKTKKDALEELRKILGNKESHIDPNKTTVTAWIDQWLKLLGRNPKERRRGLVNPRTLERYGQLLDHAKARFGNTALQKLTGTMIDDLYVELEQKLAARTVLHLHNCLRPCLAKAVKQKLIRTNPADDADAPNPGNKNVATILDEGQLQKLVRGFRGHPLEMIVDVAANTGARRNEIIGLQWSDIDLDQKTMTICRSVEETIEHGRHTKEPKTQRGFRTFAIDDALAERLREYRDQIKHLIAGVPDDASVDLGLIKVPEDALLFPGEPEVGKDISLTKLRDAHAVTRTFVRHAKKLGFKMRFHDLRATHLTILLDKGVPPHVVAARAGHDVVTLWRNYAKWTKKADAKVAETIGDISKGMI